MHLRPIGMCVCAGVLVLGVAPGSGPLARAAEFPPGFEERVVVEGLRQPTALAWGPGGEAWITGKEGEVWLVRPGEAPLAVAALPVDTEGERGVSGIAVDPGYPENRHVWVYYTRGGETVHNRLSRFTHAEGRLRDETVVIDFPPLATIFHNAGCLRFAPDGTLFVSVGDGGERAAAPDPRDLRGKILHLRRDGSPAKAPPATGPPGPPRAGRAAERQVAVADPRVWARGFRNPWRFSLQPGTGALFIADVGEDSWEELNLGVEGGHFGWPFVEGPEPPGQAGYVYPIFSYPHDPERVNSITGGDHAKPGDLAPEYEGNYFFGDWGTGDLFRMELDGANRPVLTELWGRELVSPVDIQFGPDGALYYVAFVRGELRRIAGPEPEAGDQLPAHTTRLRPSLFAR